MDYQGKKIAILGYGTEGQSAYRYFKKHGAEITVCDKNTDLDLPKGVVSQLGPDYLKHLDDFDLIVRSPGVMPYEFETTTTVSSVNNEFLANCPGTVVGVTGSKGKGTTATLIYEILKAAGKTVFLGGNIGRPPLDFLGEVNEGEYVVLELSNLQLWDIQHSPQIAVVLDIFPEHLDWHRGDMADYVAAKANIAKYQKANDLVVYNARNQYARQIGESAPGRKLPYLDSRGADIKDGGFQIDNQSIAASSDVQLIGEHNLANVCAAIAATWHLVEDREAIQTAIRQFKGLEHRLQLVAEVRGIKYYDDSIGTTPESTVAAIKSFEEPKALILGGSDKGADFNVMAEEVAASNVTAVILIGETAGKIKAALTKAGFHAERLVEGLTDMEQIVKTAADKAEAGDIVLLSPACASFGMFKNYQDRGRQFQQAVKKL